MELPFSHHDLDFALCDRPAWDTWKIVPPVSQARVLRKMHFLEGAVDDNRIGRRRAAASTSTRCRHWAIISTAANLSGIPVCARIASRGTALFQLHTALVKRGLLTPPRPREDRQLTPSNSSTTYSILALLLIALKSLASELFALPVSAWHTVLQF